MTNRERFQKVMNFQKVDRLPMIEWAPWWDKTMEAWKDQGLKIEDSDKGLSQGEALQKQMGLDLNMVYGFGITGKDTPEPAYHGAPLCETEQEYERILPTLYPKDAVNVRQLEEMARRQASGEAITWFTLTGFFWGPRVLFGIEPHLYAFYDEPELMHRMNRDILEYNLYLMERVFEVLTPDFMTFSEDMSYNNGPMISEQLFDEFMLPYYQKIVPLIKAKGTKVFVDSDGDIKKALPWFERAGIEGILPLERQAGVDVAELRQSHPNFLFIGHYDKMVMPKGEAAMRAEFERLLPVMKQGGFLPSVDHQTPPGVSLEQYKIYVRLFEEYVKRAASGLPAAMAFKFSR